MAPNNYIPILRSILSPEALAPLLETAYGFTISRLQLIKAAILDTSSANAHVSVGGEVTLFDFDFCGLGWRVYDLATFLIGESPEIASAFLEGYQAVRTLTGEEKQLIPLFQIAQNIWMLGTRASYINEWGDYRFTDAFVDHVMDQIQITFEIYRLDEKPPVARES